MAETPTFGRYAEIPYDQFTLEQQEAYRSISSDKFRRAPDLLHLSNSFGHCARKKRSYGANGRRDSGIGPSFTSFDYKS